MNKPRLIDANALLDKLPYPIDYAESEFYGKILDVIEAMPTAYDIDKVVEQLEKQKNPYANNIFLGFCHRCMWKIHNGAIDKAIEIVKGGAE